MASLRERIVAEVARRIGLIVAGNATGKPGTVYANTMASVQRWELEGNSRAALPCAIIAAKEETYSNAPTEQLTATLSVAVEVWAAHNRTTHPVSTDAYVNSLLRDVVLAILGDRGLLEGGTGQQLATSVDPVLAYPLEDEEGHPFCGAVLELSVQYQHSLLDPDFFV